MRSETRGEKHEPRARERGAISNDSTWGEIGFEKGKSDFTCAFLYRDDERRGRHTRLVRQRGGRSTKSYIFLPCQMAFLHAGHFSSLLRDCLLLFLCLLFPRRCLYRRRPRRGGGCLLPAALSPLLPACLSVSVFAPFKSNSLHV